MVAAIGENESNNEVEKTPIASSLSEDKSKKYRITVEPLGFLVLTASIIQVRYKYVLSSSENFNQFFIV